MGRVMDYDFTDGLAETSRAPLAGDIHSISYGYWWMIRMGKRADREK